MAGLDRFSKSQIRLAEHQHVLPMIFAGAGLGSVVCRQGEATSGRKLLDRGIYVAKPSQWLVLHAGNDALHRGGASLH